MQNRECEFDFLKNSFKTAKFVERLRKRRQNNLSGKFHILLNNTQTQNYAFKPPGKRIIAPNFCLLS